MKKIKMWMILGGIWLWALACAIMQKVPAGKILPISLLTAALAAVPVGLVALVVRLGKWCVRRLTKKPRKAKILYLRREWHEL